MPRLVRQRVQEFMCGAREPPVPNTKHPTTSQLYHILVYPLGMVVLLIPALLSAAREPPRVVKFYH